MSRFLFISSSFLAVLVLSVCCIGKGENSIAYPGAGDPVPPVVLTTLGGDSVALQSAQGATLLVFFNVGCGDCRSELPVIEEFHRLRGEEVRVIAVGRDHVADEIGSYWEREGFTMPACADPGRGIYGCFASRGIPYLVAVESGRIIATLPSMGGAMPTLEDIGGIFGFGEI